MQSLDLEVLACLKQDGRMSVEDMATCCQAEPKAIAESLDRLKAEQVLIGCTAVINHRKVPDAKSPIRAFVELSISPQKSSGYDEIGNRIAKFPNVTAQYLLSGHYDFLVLVEGASHDEVAGFVFDKLATMEMVNSTTTHFIFKSFKEAGVVLDAEPPLRRQAVQV